jgi:asparagine synthase (glutamine-hydrolysing)
MCGLIGIIGGVGDAQRSAALRSLASRGPDGAAQAELGPAWLAHTLLALRDTPERSRQPMHSRCGRVAILFNGEIYNVQALRERHGSVLPVPSTSTDTELVLDLFMAHGVDGLGELDGIYALAIVDARQAGGAGPVVTLLRDLLGVKPLLYAHRENRFAFASTALALVEAGVARRVLDRHAIAHFLHLGAIAEPATPFEDVRAVEPGACLQWHAGQLRPRGLRALRAQPGPPADGARRTAELMAAAVERQLADQAEANLMLSGGLDSSVLAHFIGARRPGARAYTLAFESGHAFLNESAEAEATATHSRLVHATLAARAHDVARDFDGFVGALDQPTLDGANAYAFMRALPRGVRVVFNGTGPDELLFGYPWVWDILDAHRSDAGLDADALSKAWLQRCTVSVAEDVGLLLRLPPQTVRDDALRAIRAVDPGPSAPLGERLQRIVLRRFTADRLLRDLDACSMAFGVEVRVPFLDATLAEHALGQPASALAPAWPSAPAPSLTYADSPLKRRMVQVAQRRVPSALLERTGKRGFVAPYDEWLRGPLAPIVAREMSLDALHEVGWQDPALVQHHALRRLTVQQRTLMLWTLVVLQAWARKHGAVFVA